jgi:N-methylhydantoinase B
VFKNLFASVAEEMGQTLQRSAPSPNIKERRDFSCSIFDAGGRLVAQGDHMPVHLGSMPASVAAALAATRLEPGDAVLLNDPYRGGTHLPDITLVSAMFDRPGGAPLFYLANRAHHADIGGMVPGSMPLSTELFQEGLIIPPVRIVRRGELCRDVLEMVLANVRTPEERRGDLLAQIGANRVGEERLRDILEREGRRDVLFFSGELQRYSERILRDCLRRIPDGAYRFSDRLDDDGVDGRPVPIRVTITVRGDRALVDFTGSAPQVAGSVNAVEAITRSAAYYVFRCLLDEEVPFNAGCFAPLEIRVPAGSVLAARRPAAVAGGNVETSQRIVDVMLGALARALPDRIPAASSGTMNNVCFGGTGPDAGPPFAYYETMGGGMGAAPQGDGLSGVHTHMTNSLNTPIEALETSYPFRVRSYRIRRRSGGRGRHRGGDGLVREIEFLTAGGLSLLTERRTFPPYGLAGGGAAATGRNWLIRGAHRRRLPAKANLEVRPGDRLRIETPGGGGWGRPRRGSGRRT